MTGQPRRDSEESQLLPRDNVGLHKQAADSRGSIPESHQGPSALLGKMDNQEATDPAYMDKKSWEMRKRALQTRDSMHVSSIHPSQVLKQNLLHKYQVPGDFTSAARSQNVKQPESKQNVKQPEFKQNVKQPEYMPNVKQQEFKQNVKSLEFMQHVKQPEYMQNGKQSELKQNGKQSEFKQIVKQPEFKQAVNNFKTSTPLRRDNRDKSGDMFRAGVGKEETNILRDIDDGERPLDRTRTYSLVRNPSFSPFSDDETETGIYPGESSPTSQAVSNKDVPGKVQLFEQFNMSAINRMNNSDYSSLDNIQSPWSMLFPKSQQIERVKAPKTNQLQDRFNRMPIPQDTLVGGQDMLEGGHGTPVRGRDMLVRGQDMLVGGQDVLEVGQLADSTDDEDIDYYLRHREEILRDAVKHSDPILPKTLRQFTDTTDKPKEATKPSSSLPVTSYPRKEVNITDIYLQSMGLKSPMFRKDTPKDLRCPPEEVHQGHEASYEKSSSDETNRQTNVLPSYTGDMTSNGKYFPFSLSPLTGDYDADVTRDYLAVLKAGGAGAITSRDASPSPDTVLGSTKRSTAGSTSDLRSFLVEKEVIESKLRKLQMENSGLQTENKLMKEKFNRAQARCQYLEAQLQSTQQEAVSLREQHEEDLTSTERKARDRGEKDKHDLEGQIIRLTRNIEMVKAENALLEKQLVAASKMPAQSSVMADTSPLIDSYKLQVQALQEELQKSRDLRQDCERQRREEAERHKEASIQIIKLTELKALLQQQLENAGGGTSTEKQVLSLERRLKITEDRLHRERSDRAGKLSEVEEKLINENAKLQVSDKESKRQLQRERDKNRNLSEKYRDTRDELETLQMELAETPLILDKNTPYQSKMSTIRSILGSKKHAEEVKHILEQIKQQENLGQGQENDIIWLLWHQREEVTKQLKEWELALNDLKIDHNNIKDGIKNLRSSQAAIETWEVKHREALEDSSAEKDSLLNTFRQQIQSLTKDKHEAIARAKNLEDINAAVTAECDALRSNDRIPGGQVASQSSDSHMWQAKMESVRMELESAQGELQEAMRSEQAATSQLHSLVTQLAARDQALDEALLTIQRLEASSQTNIQGEEWRLQKVDLLQAELTASEKEIETWREKCRGLEREKTDLEERVDSMNKRLMRSKPTPDTSVTESFVESDKLSLETELHEKDRQVHHLTVSYNEVENELQRSKQHLLVEQERNTELTQQLSQLQTQLRQKTRIMEKMANAEADYQRELQAARENLASVNRDLAQKNQELRMTAVDLEKEKSRSEKFRGDLQHRDQLLSQDIAALVHQGALSSSLASDSSRNARDVLAQAEMKSRLADYEKEILRHENDRGNHVIESLVTENSELHARIQEVKQELIKERAHVCQITTEKSSLEQKCHVVEDERDAAVRQRAHLEQDLSQREAKTQTVISRLEQEAQQASHDYTEKYEHLDAQGKQMAVELSTTRRLLEAREKEIDILRDSVYRQKQEIASLQRRISVLSEENLVCREDIEKLTTELTRKMKESAVTVETQQLLSSERSKLQIEKHQLEKDFSKSRLEAEHHRTEVTELKHKLEIVEDRQTRTEKQLFEKEAQIVAMETEVKNTNKASTALESDHIETKALAEKLNQGLEAVLFSQGPEHESLYKEKSTSSNLRDELTHALHQLELIRQGHDLQVSNLQSERRTLDMLKEKYQTEEERAYHLEDRIRTHALELETVRGHLADTKTGWEQCKNDKQTLYQDVQDLCRKLADRDETIAGLQEKCSLTVETIQRECGSEKVALTTDKMRLESDLAKTRHELEDCRDLLKQKELQLEVYYRTSHDLQEETRAKGDLEMEVTRLQATLAQANLKLSGLQSENSRLQDSYKQTLASLDESRHSNLSLKEQLREQKEETSREIKELRMSSTNQTHRLDMEKGELQDLYTKTQADLRAAEASLAALIETKQSLQDSNRHYESTVETLKSQVHEEITAKRLMEQRLETVKEQLEDVRTRKAGFDEKNMELQSQLSRMESELSVEREKSRKLRQEISDSQNTSLTAEQQAQALQMHIAELQAEVSSLRSQLETHKQTLAGKNKRLTLELKQQADDFDKERTKLLHEAQQLSSDVEQTRQQVAQKNRENLRLQEEILGLEERVRDTSRQSRQAQDALKGEESSRDVLENRNLELELLLAKLRTKDSDDASFEATRNEVTRMLSELSRRMQTQLEQQKTTDTEARQKDQKKIEELKNKIAAIEAALGQEQALYIVTKSNVTSLEDDNQRLRQQLQIARKRTTGSSNDTDSRSKSRLEEINEIIARSQTRAQQLLATGAYGEDALKSLSPNNDYLSPRVPSPSPQRYTPTDPGVNGTAENQYRQHKY